MRTWRNLVGGVGGSAWSAIVGLAVVPVYFRVLGVEAYGLVGFFVALQAVFQVLDMGMAPTISREVARCDATGELADARNLLRTLAVFYWLAAVLICIVVVASASYLGTDWLNAATVPQDEVTRSIALMGVAIAIRFPVGLYIGAMQGAQRVAEASALNAIMTTLGALGAVAVIVFGSPTTTAFFGWQAVVALVHVLAVRWAAWRYMGGARLSRFDPDWLRRVGVFAVSMSVVSVLGVVFAQLDKLVLSRSVELAELGLYTLAGFPARSLAILAAPVFTVIYARLSAMIAVDDTAGVVDLYRNGTRLFLAFLLPLAVFVGVFAESIIGLWTGDFEIAARVAPVAALLILGSALNGTMLFPFALQLANGNSRIPMIITVVLIIGFVPLLIWLVANFGILGAAGAWFLLNAAYVPFGTWMTHRSMLKGHGVNWLVADVGLPLLVAVVIVGGGGIVIREMIDTPLVQIALGSLALPLAFVLTAAMSPSMLPAQARRYVRQLF